MLYYGYVHKITGYCYGKGFMLNLQLHTMQESWFMGVDRWVGHRRNINSPKEYQEGEFNMKH